LAAKWSFWQNIYGHWQIIQLIETNYDLNLWRKGFSSLRIARMMPRDQLDASVTPQRRFAVRPFSRKDAAALLELMQMLAAFESYLDDFQVAAEDLIVHGLGNAPRFGAFVAEAEDSGHLVGMAVHYPIPWTYDMKPTLVLKELYVVEAWRGTGVGRALLKAVLGHAATLGASRLKWTVLAGNERARQFYRSIGGRPDVKWEPWIFETHTDSAKYLEGED
jgi:GNAT superfamily N-acetyltransferase